MKNYRLDKEEQEILKALKKGELKLVKNQKTEIAKLKAAAKAHCKAVRS